MWKNVPYWLQFNFQLTLAYFPHYIKERKAKRILMNRDNKQQAEIINST